MNPVKRECLCLRKIYINVNKLLVAVVVYLSIFFMLQFVVVCLHFYTDVVVACLLPDRVTPRYRRVDCAPFRVAKRELHTYIIGHYKPSVRITA